MGTVLSLETRYVFVPKIVCDHNQCPYHENSIIPTEFKALEILSSKLSSSPKFRFF